MLITKNLYHDGRPASIVGTQEIFDRPELGTRTYVANGVL